MAECACGLYIYMNLVVDKMLLDSCIGLQMLLFANIAGPGFHVYMDKVKIKFHVYMDKVKI